MNLRLVSAALCLVPFGLDAKESEFARWLNSEIVASPEVPGSPATPVQENVEAKEWLSFDFSAEQLEAQYERTLRAAPGDVEQWTTNLMSRIQGGAKVMIPVIFQVQAKQGEEEAKADAEVAGEGPVVEAPEEMRLKQLEMENAALKERLAGLEPFVDPDWPAAAMRPKGGWRARLRRRPVRWFAPQVSPRLDVANSRHSVRFKAFTRAAMETPAYGGIPRARAQSHQEQLRFFQNATKALGVGVGSREYRGVRREVENAMLNGELTARYAVQYLADVVDVFRTYERLERFGLTDGIAPPMSADSFRRDPGHMFRWASEVGEQKRKLNLEESLAR